ncbi:MAG: hypothetical protein LBJ12_03760 [Oscillospiraceae bacterium]|jgi:hypothetical protein|nr:hypothetical protein [Oscillospiraceae bacterium]
MEQQTFNKPVKRVRNLRKISLGLSIFLAAVLIISSTFAWFMATDKIKNPFKQDPPALNGSVTEIWTPPTNPPIPGEEIEKTVAVQNTGTIPMFARLLIFPSMMAADGITLLQARIGQEIELIDLNTTDWKADADGYYYYLKRIGAGTSSTSLFTKVKLADDLGAEYEGAKLMIDIKLEGTDIVRWSYREAWWGSSAAPSAPAEFVAIDAALSPLTIDQ